MKRGKDEDKIIVPMFPRLHVNDTDTGGPRAPPRNKMALYEQLSIPSQRFSHGVLPFNPTNTSNQEPSASSSQLCFQGTGKERSKFFSHQLPSRYQAEKSYGQYSKLSTQSTQVEQKKKLDEDDFTVPIFTESHSNQDHGKSFSDLDAKKITTSHCADSNHSLKFPRVADKDLKQTSMAVGSSNQEGKCLKEVNTRDFVAAQEMLNKALLNLSSLNKTEGLRKHIDGSQFDEPIDNPVNSIHINRLQKVDINILPELCDKSQPAGSVHSNAVMRESSLSINSRHFSSFTDFPVEEQNIIHDLNDDMTSREKSSCRSPQMENIDKCDSASETSMVDSLSELDISPDDVVEKIGQKHFWKARRAITNQQRAFAFQVFELHRLIKVQRLIAMSPYLLLDDPAYLDKPVISPAKKLPLDYIAKAPPKISKRKSNSEKPNIEIECSAENIVGKTPLSSGQNSTQPSTCRSILGNPLSTAASSDHNSGPWYFNQAQGHQWLIPVMSPSEGLVYKPYPGPGFMGPVCGPQGLAPWMSNFSAPGYGVPASNHQYQVPSFPPAGPQGYFPTYGMPFANPAFSGLSVEHTNHFNVQNLNSCNMLRQTNEAVPNVIKPHAAKNNELQTSTASSPTERPQCSREGHAMVGTNALQLLPSSPAVNVPDCGIQSPEPDCPARVIKVVPRNARSATESAARIFQFIQAERKQYE